MVLFRLCCRHFRNYFNNCWIYVTIMGTRVLKRYAGRGLRASDAPFSRTEGLKVTFTHFYEGFWLYVKGGGKIGWRSFPPIISRADSRTLKLQSTSYQLSSYINIKLSSYQAIKSSFQFKFPIIKLSKFSS